MKMQIDLIAAVADNEIDNPVLREFLLSEINNSEELKYEFIIQRVIKSLVSRRMPMLPLPISLKSEIRSKIRGYYNV